MTTPPVRRVRKHELGRQRERDAVPGQPGIDPGIGRADRNEADVITSRDIEKRVFVARHVDRGNADQVATWRRGREQQRAAEKDAQPRAPMHERESAAHVRVRALMYRKMRRR